jgi:hypothetical protein
MRHPHTVGQLYGVPHVILRIYNTILYENEFQNPLILVMDYYSAVHCSILPPTSFIRGKSLSHKTKQPLLHLGILRNVNNFYKIVNIFQTF